MSGRRRGCGCGFLVLILVILAVLRLNLPPSKVSDAVDLSALEEEGKIARIIGEKAVEFFVKDEFAGWQYRDFLVFKTAKSERFDLMAVGLPFCKWKIYVLEDE
jgi:hypothetical protein